MDAAKLLIDQAKVDPLTVTMLIEALEHTWASVADQFQGHPAKIYGPITIANYLVTLAETGERDALVLRRSALSRVQSLLRPPKNYRFLASEVRSPVGFRYITALSANRLVKCSGGW